MMSRKKWEELYKLERDLRQTRIDLQFETKRTQDAMIELHKYKLMVDRLQDANESLAAKMKTYKDEIYDEVYQPGGKGFVFAKERFENAVGSLDEEDSIEVVNRCSPLRRHRQLQSTLWN
jgi:hypothetical protein